MIKRKIDSKKWSLFEYCKIYQIIGYEDDVYLIKDQQGYTRTWR